VKVRYSPRAFADLEAIYDYIRKRSPDAALRVKDAIALHVAGLADFPEKGIRSDEGDVRTWPTGRLGYRIYYRIEADEVLILHIRHAARRPLGPADL
jgi:toxin ParE1/3/4